MSETVRNGHPFGQTAPIFAGNMLSLTETAEAAGISLRALNRMRARGVGPLITELDGRKLVARYNLERWLQAHTQPRPGACPPAYC